MPGQHRGIASARGTSGLRYHRPRDGAAVATKFSDRLAGLRPHRYIVDTAALAPIALPGLGEQTHAETPRCQIGDLAVLGNVALVTRVACEGQSGIGERENEAAVTEAVPIDHVDTNAHGENGETRAHFFDLHSHGAASLVHRPHGIRARTGDLGRVARHLLAAVNLGARFSRKAPMPSATSGKALAMRCRSRARSISAEGPRASMPLTAQTMGFSREVMSLTSGL